MTLVSNSDMTDGGRLRAYMPPPCDPEIDIFILVFRNSFIITLTFLHTCMWTLKFRLTVKSAVNRDTDLMIHQVKFIYKAHTKQQLLPKCFNNKITASSKK